MILKSSLTQTGSGGERNREREDREKRRKGEFENRKILTEDFRKI